MAISAALGPERTIGSAFGDIRYRDTGGAGRPVVFVHGVFVNADLWRDVVPVLGPDFRCLTPDWPLGSHAVPAAAAADLSPPALGRAIVGFLEALDLRDAVLVANDTGGALVQIAVAQNAERIGALVLTNCDAFEAFFPPALRPLPPLARIPGLIDALGPVLRVPVMQYGLIATVAHRRPEPAIVRSYTQPFGTSREVRRDTAKVIAAVANRHTLAAAAAFATFTKPVAVGWGDDDFFFTPALGLRLARAFPRATFRRIPNSRTLVPEDAPLAVAGLVRDVAAR